MDTRRFTCIATSWRSSSGERRTSRRPIRPALWREVGAFIENASPASGIDQAQAAELNLSVLEALSHAKDWRGALAAAQDKVTLHWAPAQTAAIEQLVQSAQALGAAGAPLVNALVELLRLNPSGDQRLYTAAQNLMTAVVQNQARITDQNRPILEDIAAICLANARSPACATLLEHFSGQLHGMLNAPADVLAAARGHQAGRVALALIDAAVTVGGQDHAQLAAAEAALDDLSPALAARSALVLLRYVYNPAVAVPLAQGLADRARHAADQPELERFAQKFSSAHPVLFPMLGDEAGPIASELSRGYGAAIAYNDVERVGQLAVAVREALPDVKLSGLITQDGAGRPGLADLRGELRHDPVPLLAKLLAPIAELDRQDPEDRLELVRRAIQVARESAMVDRPIETAFPRIEDDWRFGLTEPKRLAFVGAAGSALAIRARSKREGLDFLRAHDRLPAELAFSAGRHLNQAQLGWLLSKIEGFRSHAQVRVMRDLVFASIESGRPDLLDAFIGTGLDQKSLMATAEMVAVELRQGRLQDLPIDLIVEKLEKDEDAIGAIRELRKGAPGAGVPATPAGQAELTRWKTELDTLIQATAPDIQVYSDKGKLWRDPLMSVIDAVGSENWPNWKAENEVGKRQLEGLSPAQIAVWMTDDLTAMSDPAQAERPEIKRAITLLKGLKLALPEEVNLNGDGFEGLQDEGHPAKPGRREREGLQDEGHPAKPGRREREGLQDEGHPAKPGRREREGLAWDRASLEKLRAEQAELVDAFHGTERGKAEHRALRRRLGPASRRIAALELALTIERVLADPTVDPVKSLLESKGALAAAESAVKTLGGRGCSQAIHQIRETAETIRSSPRDGRYAIDENSLEGFIQSFTGSSCLRPNGGSNQVSLIEHVASAMYKIARVVDAGTTEVRGFARLYRYTFPGFERGHAIELDILRQPNGGQNAPPASVEALHEHMLAKAEAMGVPYLTSDPVALKLAEARGLRVLESQSVTFHVDHGHTGLHHAQNIDYGTYWILWEHAHTYGGLVQEPDANVEAARVYTKHVILPRGVEIKDEA